MDWRRRFYTTLAPGLLSGITAGDWLRLLAQNRFRIDSEC